MIARLTLLAVALAVVLLLAGSLREHDACEQARVDVFAAATGAKPAGLQEQGIDGIREHCRGAQNLVSASAILFRQDRLDEARALAQEAVDAEPENATAWNALATITAETDPATARRAAERAVALSPLDPPAVPLADEGPAGP